MCVCVCFFFGQRVRDPNHNNKQQQQQESSSSSSSSSPPYRVQPHIPAEHPSPATKLPSSQISGSSTTALPQTGVRNSRTNGVAATRASGSDPGVMSPWTLTESMRKVSEVGRSDLDKGRKQGKSIDSVSNWQWQWQGSLLSGQRGNETPKRNVQATHRHRTMLST